MTFSAYDKMIGVTMTSVVVDDSTGDNEMIFKAVNGDRFIFYHSQDCCENVRVEDTCGDLSDLVGAPILEATETRCEDATGDDECTNDSGTWTFYRFSTVKGTVTVRWLGTSNGYYSESVDFRYDPAQD